jgi:hypothetical protein
VGGKGQPMVKRALIWSFERGLLLQFPLPLPGKLNPLNTHSQYAMRLGIWEKLKTTSSHHQVIVYKQYLLEQKVNTRSSPSPLPSQPCPFPSSPPNHHKSSLLLSCPQLPLPSLSIHPPHHKFPPHPLNFPYPPYAVYNAIVSG